MPWIIILSDWLKLYVIFSATASPKDCYLVQMWGPLQKFFISSRSDKMHGCYRQFLFLIGWKTLKIFSFKVQMSWHIFGEEIKLTLKKCYQNSNSYPLLTYKKYTFLCTISLQDISSSKTTFQLHVIIHKRHWSNLNCRSEIILTFLLHICCALFMH